RRPASPSVSQARWPALQQRAATMGSGPKVHTRLAWSGGTTRKSGPAILAAQHLPRGLQARISELFLPTKPIWYGLWARSPLLPRAAGVLAILLETLKDSLAGA